MCTIYEDDTGRNYAFVKGDPDFLLPYCTKYINKYGRVSKIDSAFSNHINSVILDFAHHSLQNILLAYKEVDEMPENWEEVEKGLIVIGVVGIENPLQDGIR